MQQVSWKRRTPKVRRDLKFHLFFYHYKSFSFIQSVLLLVQASGVIMRAIAYTVQGGCYGVLKKWRQGWWKRFPVADWMERWPEGTRRWLSLGSHSLLLQRRKSERGKSQEPTMGGRLSVSLPFEWRRYAGYSGAPVVKRPSTVVHSLSYRVAGVEPSTGTS